MDFHKKANIRFLWIDLGFRQIYDKIALNGSFNALKKCLSRGGNAIFVEDQNTLNHCRE